jgi:ornithine carbamoyltransferase
MYGCAKMGMQFVAYGPAELCEQVDADVVARAREVAAQTGASIEVSSDLEAIKDADVLYTDIWASMGEEEQIPERVRLLTPYRVTEEMMAATGNPDAIFMHCLPAYRGYEVTEDVIDGPQSVVFDEAENRLHAHKAILVNCFLN